MGVVTTPVDRMARISWIYRLQLRLGGGAFGDVYQGEK